MKKTELIVITSSNGSELKFNGYLTRIISILAYKYGKINKYKILEDENECYSFYYLQMKGIRDLIQIECSKLHCRVSKKQINVLFKKRKGKHKIKFPYTAMVILEAIYNLLKDDKRPVINLDWKDKFYIYLRKDKSGKLMYEKFSIGDIVDRLISVDTREKHGQSSYSEIYRFYITSRELFYKKAIPNLSIEQLTAQDFPWDFFNKNDIPISMREYNDQRIYIKE